MKNIAGQDVNFRHLIRQIETFFSVETKDGETKPFKLNNKQNQLVDDIMAAPEPKRILILKGRQFGISTIILALFFIKCLWIKNTRAAVISHTEDATKKLFRRINFFTKMFTIRPALDKESEKEYSFPKSNSYFYIGTAGTKTFGRGDNLTDLHCSEVAFWDNAGAIMNGLLQAVGKTGNIYIETTANGIGNYFHRLWIKSWKEAQASWRAVFYSWIDFDEYELDTNGLTRTAYEQHLVDTYKLTDRKLAWRRWKVNETETDGGYEPEQIFKQEYPLTPEEAFLASGNPVFNQAALLSYKTQEGEREGQLLTYERPCLTKNYFIGVDVAEGNEQGDYSVIQIIDHTLAQAAEWHGHIDPDLLAIEVKTLAVAYNNAIVGVESNNQGIATLNKLKEIYPLWKIYHREVLDENFKTTTKKIGWQTSTASRLVMVADLLSFVREHRLIIRSKKLIDECLSFIRNKKGKPEAQQGCYDDRVMAMAVALQMWKAFPTFVNNPPKEAIPEDWNYKHWNERMRIKKAKKKNQYVVI